MSSVRMVHAALEPAVELLRPIPIPAIIPPLILLLGVDDAMKIFIVAFSAFLPLLVNTIAGSSGIGYYIMTIQYAMRSSDMYAAIFVLAALGYGLNRGFLAIEHRVLHWYHL